MLVLGGFDCLEIPRFRCASNFPHVSCVVLPGCSGGLMVFAAEDCEVWGPPAFGVVGRPGHWGMIC